MSGICGVVSKNDCAETLLYSTDYHSHLGTEYGGLAVLGEDFTRQIHDVSQSQFKSKFYDDMHSIKGSIGIGVISALDEQPIYLNSKFGPFCLVTDGFLDNAQDLVQELLGNGVTFSEVGKGVVNLTELVAKLITRGDSLVDGIENSLVIELLNRLLEFTLIDKKFPPAQSPEHAAPLFEFCQVVNGALEVRHYALGLPAARVESLELIGNSCLLQVEDLDLAAVLKMGKEAIPIAYGKEYGNLLHGGESHQVNPSSSL